MEAQEPDTTNLLGAELTPGRLLAWAAAWAVVTAAIVAVTTSLESIINQPGRIEDGQ